MERIEKAKEILSKIIYVTIATSSKDGKPWNTPVTAVFDEKFNCFWTSWSGTQHSNNIRTNPDVFIVVYDSTAPIGLGSCVYIKAKAEEMSDPVSIEEGSSLLYQRKNKPPRKSEEFLGDSPRRLYKATLEKSWLSLDSDAKVDFMNTRKEIALI